MVKIPTFDIFTTMIEWANSNFQPQPSLGPLSQFLFVKFVIGFDMKLQLSHSEISMASIWQKQIVT